MIPDQASLLADTRLSREARLIGLYVAALGDGPHEVSHDTFRQLLGRGGTRGGLAKNETIAGYISELATLGWVDQNVHTGRGHSPAYTFNPPSKGGANEEIAPLLRRGLNIDPPLKGVPNTDRPPSEGVLNAPSSYSPVPTPPPERAHAHEGQVTPEAEAAIERASETLNGCRGSLRDYLRQRVEPRHQVGYVQRVVTSLEGGDEWMWKDRRMQTLTEGRTKLLAAAFNELMAGDEVGQYFADPPGGFGNLRSKVRYLVASALGVENDAKRNAGRAAAAPGTEPRARSKHPEVHVES